MQTIRLYGPGVFSRVAWACTLIAVMWLLPARAEDLKHPIPEPYIQNGQLAAYVQEAFAFLNQHPDSILAPRVALDVLMLADRFQNRTLAASMKRILLFRYADSLQGRHTIGGFKDAQTLVDFVNAHAEDQLQANPAVFAAGFSDLVEGGLHHFNQALLDNDDFLIAAYFLAETAGASQTADALKPFLETAVKQNQRLGALFATLSDKTNGTVEKVLGLHQQEPGNDILEAFYISRLSVSDRKMPAIRRILIEKALDDKRFEEALSLLEAMPAAFRAQPKIRFWKARILLALDACPEALESLAGLIAAHPDSQWAAVADIYRRGIQDIDALKNANANAILAAVNVLNKGIDTLQAVVTFSSRSETGVETRHRIYVALHSPTNQLELAWYQNDRLTLGYRTRKTESSLYIPGQEKIHVFGEPAAIPVPSLALNRADNGEFIFEAGLELTATMPEAGAKTADFLRSKYLSTLAGIKELISQTIARHGWVPAAPESDQGKTSFTWYHPVMNQPQLKQMGYRISKDHLITAIHYEHFRIEPLVYGKAKAPNVTPPRWPDFPRKHYETFDLSVWFEFIGAAMRLFDAETKPEPIFSGKAERPEKSP